MTHEVDISGKMKLVDLNFWGQILNHFFKLTARAHSLKIYRSNSFFRNKRFPENFFCNCSVVEIQPVLEWNCLNRFDRRNMNFFDNLFNCFQNKRKLHFGFSTNIAESNIHVKIKVKELKSKYIFKNDNFKILVFPRI